MPAAPSKAHPCAFAPGSLCCDHSRRASSSAIKAKLESIIERALPAARPSSTPDAAMIRRTSRRARFGLSTSRNIAGTVTTMMTRLSGPMTFATASPAGCQARGASIHAISDRPAVPSAATVSRSRNVTETVAPALRIMFTLLRIMFTAIHYDKRDATGSRRKQGVAGRATAAHHAGRDSETSVLEAVRLATVRQAHRGGETLGHPSHAECQP